MILVRIFLVFLNTVKQLDELAYLSDYAHYEWLKYLSYRAADSDSYCAFNLIKIPEEEMNHVRFNFCPICLYF